MDTLINVLQKYANDTLLKENFEWNIPDDCPLKIPNDISDVYLRNIFLKENLHTLLSSERSLENRYWVIQKWGGVRSLKATDRNNLILNKLDSELEKGILTKPTFSIISSTSKVASFLDHRQYAIYDSRVIYALNWLLFKYTNQTEFYPQPSGRSSDLAKYEFSTILNLSGKSYTWKSHKTAYHEYCNLMKEFSLKIYKNRTPYLVEMLLFIIAPKQIVSDIKNSVSLNISVQ
ncbi:hypothetical protein GCM10009112_08960 [Marinomonas arenicola]|uniref:hypothetical protein n=1 Tax=Marinomonas TaxID=28253 RepID=UPI001054F1CF|nr:hypothetical protein [Marinomonas sp. KMM3893]